MPGCAQPAAVGLIRGLGPPSPHLVRRWRWILRLSGCSRSRARRQAESPSRLPSQRQRTGIRFRFHRLSRFRFGTPRCFRCVGGYLFAGCLADFSQYKEYKLYLRVPGVHSDPPYKQRATWCRAACLRLLHGLLPGSASGTKLAHELPWIAQRCLCRARSDDATGLGSSESCLCASADLARLFLGNGSLDMQAEWVCVWHVAGCELHV